MTGRIFSTLTAVALASVLTSCASLQSFLMDDDSKPAKRTARPASDPDREERNAAILDGLAANSNLGPGVSFLVRSGRSLQRANEDLTPQQEYYLGRAFGAQVLATRAALDDQAANRYLNLIGQTLARYSERPDTWAGYRFQLLDSPEVNAFAAPGGFIFVTRGLVKATRNEDELAAVLAHEIAHVELEHGLKAIRKDRLTTAVVGIGSDAAQTFGGSKLQELSAAFEGSVSDLTKTIVNNGYAKETEYEADASALDILERAGYPPQALLTMLEALKTLPKAGEGGFTRTHPTPAARIAAAKKNLTRVGTYALTPAQKARYTAALGGL